MRVGANPSRPPSDGQGAAASWLALPRTHSCDGWLRAQSTAARAMVIPWCSCTGSAASSACGSRCSSHSAGLDLIAVDLPGFGHSPPLPDGVTPTPRRWRRRGRADRRAPPGSGPPGGQLLGGWLALELGKTARARSVTAICPAGLSGACAAPGGRPARGRAKGMARRLRPALPLLMRSRRVRRLALGLVVADPDRVPREAAIRMVDSYARATAYEATNPAMRRRISAAPTRSTCRSPSPSASSTG